eukprot:IDg4368t1
MSEKSSNDDSIRHSSHSVSRVEESDEDVSMSDQSSDENDERITDSENQMSENYINQSDATEIPIHSASRENDDAIDENAHEHQEQPTSRYLIRTRKPPTKWYMHTLSIKSSAIEVTTIDDTTMLEELNETSEERSLWESAI